MPAHKSTVASILSRQALLLNGAAMEASAAFSKYRLTIPGYGFSGKPTTTGWNTDRIARA